MAAAKRILVVDDHFAIRSNLRVAMIEAIPECMVSAVPSAEEGVLELRGGELDLLVTAVHLPGMSGIDLAQRLHKLGRETAVILLVDNAQQAQKAAAADFHIAHILQKPVTVEDVMSAVKATLGDAAVDTAPLPPSPLTEPTLEKIAKLLHGLQADISALGLFLADRSGEVLCRLGTTPDSLTADLIALIGENLKNSLQIGALLDAGDPFTLQYHAGEEIELYFANLDAERFVGMIFDASARRGRISTVYVFTQRVLREIKELLAAEPTAAPAPADEGKGTAVPVPMVAEAASPPPESELNVPLPTQITPTPEQSADFIDIAPEQLAALLTKNADIDAEVDAFWDEAVEDISGRSGKGLSFAEAKRQGLIPKDLDEDLSS
jgi:DNA-binding NarL/FixJ family response regulator